ncbi:ABC transporter substrate-binding protein [Natrarchaeobius oligotrophus]|uniref:ABC transporter substrate-binding protein n=1 Tax=Natrarchaeobius oligotrophus TaxID=3455743 RepID=UPI0014055190|nr:ABC transporter substrate-binding protein [Natrarchaeobius chitinivorans]
MGLAGCTGSDDDADLTVGLSIPLSGDFSGNGAQYQAAFETWEDKIEEQGGIDGHDVELRYDDNDSQEDQASRIANQYVDDEVDFVVSAYSSPLARAMAGPLEQAGIPFVTTGSNNDEIHAESDTMYMFEPPVDRRAEGNVLENEGVTEVAALVVDLGWARIMHDRFVEDIAPQHGIDVVYEDVHATDIDDFSSFILQAEESDADAIITTNYPEDVVNVLRSMTSQGYEPEFVSSHTANLPSVGEQLGDTVEGLCVPTCYAETFDTHENDDFPDRFREVRSSDEIELDVNAANGYGVLQTFEQAVENAGPDPESINESLRNDEFDTVIGTTTFDDRGVQEGFWSLEQWHSDSSLELVWPDDEATGDFIHPKPWN